MIDLNKVKFNFIPMNNDNKLEAVVNVDFDGLIVSGFTIHLHVKQERITYNLLPPILFGKGKNHALVYMPKEQWLKFEELALRSYKDYCNNRLDNDIPKIAEIL